MPGPATRREASRRFVRAGGSPEMEAPEGTSAPMSSPLGPVERQGLLGWSARRVR